jgi:uncharacterized protein YPO0396
MNTEESGQILEFPNAGASAGFRLERLELLNWGTFHEHVWALDVRSENALVTGDIGSGKSTLVDAITTLLVPPQRQQYNKAAGAETKERSARSYFLGYYKKERSEGSSSKPVGLREPGSYSVLLARFRNQALEADVTVAQVFWMGSADGQPERIYLVADRVLTIKEHFADFGQEVGGLKKRLRKLGVELNESFPPYASAFRRRFGLENEQALALFQQTVSMKSVGNLTDFVRDHMLDAFPIEERVAVLLGHFESLQKAHDAVLRAKEQIEALTPIVDEGARHTAAKTLIAKLTACRRGVPAWFASAKIELLTAKNRGLNDDLKACEAELAEQIRLRDEDRASRDGLKTAISEAGGDRIEQIKEQIGRHEKERERRRQNAERYGVNAVAVGLAREVDPTSFEANRRWIEEERPRLDAEEIEVQTRVTTASVELEGLRAKRLDLEAEIESLGTRLSNIPLRNLELRWRMTQALGLDETEIPYAGELIQVEEAAAAWEGAIERVLHGLALSLLVHDRHYDRVARWIDQTHLGARVFYLRVREGRGAGTASMRSDSLPRKVQVQPQSPFFPWLHSELAHRFAFVCCETIDEFRREEKAITKSGQVKYGNERHEKDDRHSINDRSHFVLGWSNERKVEALKGQLEALERRIVDQTDAVAKPKDRLKHLRERSRILDRLADVDSFAELDWPSIAEQIKILEGEWQALEASSDKLRTLQEQLRALESKMTERDGTITTLEKSQTKFELAIEQARKDLGTCTTQLSKLTDDERSTMFPDLELLRSEALGPGHTWILDNCHEEEREMQSWLQDKIQDESESREKLGQGVVRRMQAYCNKYPIETRELGPSIDALDEYGAMRDKLVGDDLPRFEQRFKQLLNENTIREIAAFQSELRRQRDSILERIGSINASLRTINYNPGRYITLLSDDAPDPDVKDFRRDLKACTEGTLAAADEGYTEDKFLQVKRIIERLRGREGSVETDRKWARKVTDVRAWFVFSASERFRSDDTEHEFYPDSGGKSGGQKEKLAYTVLAASLAYQFGIDSQQPKPRSFRFIVIDEACGRGSDDSATYALTLFAQLGLQLLIVTPLQKIHVIEPHVSSVGFVHNEDGRASKLRNLTIEEYRAERAARGR